MGMVATGITFKSYRNCYDKKMSRANINEIYIDFFPGIW